MTTLYISTAISTNKEDVATMIANQGVECQVYENCSAYTEKNKCAHHELGFKIKLFNLERDDFKEKVWDTLATKLDLTCAHIKYRDEFRGCVLNWPKVFVKSQCTWESNDSPSNDKKRQRVDDDTK